MEATSNRSYNFQFTCNKHEQQDVFQGSTRHILPYSQEDEASVKSVLWKNRAKKISIIYFGDEQNKEKYSRWAETAGEAAYVPDLKLFDEELYGIGRPVGIPLKNWIGKKGLKLWELDQSGGYKRAGTNLRKVGKWLGAGVYDVHCAGQFIGDLLNSTFVDEKAQRVSFVRRDNINYQNTSLVVGIQQDLMQLVDFVKAVSLTCSNTSDPKVDVNMFLDLHQEILNQGNGNWPTTLNEMQLMSYFLCHTPLFWDTEQRQSFCYTYWSLRQHGEVQFDIQMPYTGSTSIASGWFADVPKLPRAFVDLYNNSNYNSFKTNQSGTRMEHLLIPFHRNCIEHVNREVSHTEPYSCAQIDEHLFNVFPDAIPKAYVEFFKSRIYTLVQKRDHLRHGILYGLDYSKFIKRKVN